MNAAQTLPSCNVTRDSTLPSSAIKPTMPSVYACISIYAAINLSMHLCESIYIYIFIYAQSIYIHIYIYIYIYANACTDPLFCIWELTSRALLSIKSSSVSASVCIHSFLVLTQFKLHLYERFTFTLLHFACTKANWASTWGRKSPLKTLQQATCRHQMLVA